MQIIIDRFEGDYAVVELENGETALLPRIFVPAGAKEGSFIGISLQEEAEAEARARIRGKMDSLFHD